jgi:Ig-like domain-containing protein
MRLLRDFKLALTVRVLTLLVFCLPRLASATGTPPIIIVQPLSLSVLNLDIAVFTVIASSLTTMTYQWYKDGTAISGATSSTLSLLNVSSANAGNYVVKITNAGGTVTSSTATLSVFAPPAITSQPTSLSITQGQTATFTVTANGSGNLYYQWSKNGAAVAGATTTRLKMSDAKLSYAGKYTVAVSNSYGVVTSSQATLAVAARPPIVLTGSASSPAGVHGFTVRFSVPAGESYIIEASPNLSDWTGIVTNDSSNGSVVFTDTAATNYPSRFYRAKYGE